MFLLLVYFWVINFIIRVFLCLDFSYQAQKELLDAELDFHKKISSGEDTTDLKRKLVELRVEVQTNTDIIF